MIIRIGFVLLMILLLLIRALKNRTKSSNRNEEDYGGMLELAERWKTHPEEFLTLEELELEVLKDWEFNSE